MNFRRMIYLMLPVTVAATVLIASLRVTQSEEDDTKQRIESSGERLVSGKVKLEDFKSKIVVESSAKRVVRSASPPETPPGLGDQVRDPTKNDVELPAKQAVTLVPSDKVQYAPKAFIEAPTERLATQPGGPPVAPNSQFANPAVEPGKVRWHNDFQTACDAASRSGKPVLLFHMMGNLDDRFC